MLKNIVILYTEFRCFYWNLPLRFSIGKLGRFLLRTAPYSLETKQTRNKYSSINITWSVVCCIEVCADGWIDLIGIKLRKGKFGSRQEWNSIYNYLIKLLNRDFTSTRYDSEINSNRRTNLEQKLIESLASLLIWPLHCTIKTFVSTGNFTVVTNEWQRESLTQESIMQ